MLTAQQLQLITAMQQQEQPVPPQKFARTQEQSLQQQQVAAPAIPEFVIDGNFMRDVAGKYIAHCVLKCSHHCGNTSKFSLSKCFNFELLLKFSFFKICLYTYLH